MGTERTKHKMRRYNHVREGVKSRMIRQKIGKCAYTEHGKMYHVIFSK